MKAKIFIAIFFLQLCTVSTGAGEEAHSTDHRHHFGVFVGNTHTDHGDDGFTVGLEYEYSLTAMISTGLLGEYASLSHDTWVVGVPFVLHPYKGLRLLAMPGVEITDDHDEFLFRLGIGYDIPLGDWVIVPGFNVDFVNNEENLVFGIAFGRAF